MLFIRTINNLINNKNFDRIGMNPNLEDIVINQNNYLLVEPYITTSILEAMAEDQTFSLNYDVNPIGIIYNLDRLSETPKKYFYACLKSILNENIQTLCDVENGIYFLASNFSIPKIVSTNDHTLHQFFIKGNNVEFYSFNELKNDYTNTIFKYLTLLSEICIDDSNITKFIPLLTSLKKIIYNQ